MNIPRKSRELFAAKILSDFRSSITGNEEFRIVNANPEDKFFVGKLISTHNGDDTTSAITSKSFIKSVGFDFYISKDELEHAVFKIYPQGDFYYRVYPTLEEEQAALLKEYNSRTVNKISSFADFAAFYEHNKGELAGVTVPIIPVYKKLQIHEDNFSMEVSLAALFKDNPEYGFIDETSDENKPLTEWMRVLEQRASDDESAYLYEVRERATIEDVLSDEKYNAFLKRSKKTSVKIQQNWDLYVHLTAKVIKDKILVSANLINNSSLFSNTQFKKDDNKKTIETLFNSGLKIELLEAEYQPIVLDYFLDDYKYDRNQAAVGNNCSIIFDEKSNSIQTEHLPVFVQKRLITNDKLAVKFSDLVEKPIQTLKDIYSKMLKELDSWNQYRDSQEGVLSCTALSRLDAEVKEFKSEIERFHFGIQIIENYPIVRKSFVLMNDTFRNTSKKYSTWRLFQIVFIVSMIPDIVACDSNLMPPDEIENTHVNDMALLYFPTGGGKTEAFLGVLAFNVFFDRFRGKSCGVTSILRYPLRLLSVQQVQRLANVLAQAEILRRATPDISSTEPFSLGYFVGDGNTPNRLTEDDFQRYGNMTQAQVDESRVIDVCPFCGESTVHLKADKESCRLIHYCDNPNCVSGGNLPLYIVDNEVYRYLPTAIISTVDKLAILGNNKNFRAILNGATRRCPIHGYTSSRNCVEHSCSCEANEFETVRMYDPAPTLFIQDELHLIRESLGTYASHYESFVDYFLRKLSKSKRGAKVIGATATISSYEAQVYHLYNKNAIRFPCASPFLNRNFYAAIDESDTQRLIMGYAPYGKAIINSVVYSLKYMRTVIFKYLQNPKLVLNIPDIGITTEEEALELIKDYWIMLEYNNVKRDGNNIEGALDTPINVELREEGITPFITRKMTGDETFQDVREVLSEVEHSSHVFEGVNLIAATSMISHGVDADRFNVMFFYGIPGNTAEYIQAYSRTGRKHSSIVIDIIRPSRETDQSYLKNFNKFHEYKDIMVEAVPINRWATKAIKCTLPGMFTGLLLNLYDADYEYSGGSLFSMKNVKRAISENFLDAKTIKAQLKEAYGCTDGLFDDDLGNQYAEEIDRFVDSIFAEILDQAWTDEKLFTGFARLGYRIMNSLRDTDAQLIVELE